MKTRSRLLPFLILAFALLLSQQGAAVHALSHLGESLPSHSQQNKQLPHSPACDKCVLYADVGAALAANALAIPATSAQISHLAIPAPVVQSQLIRRYHARAPPALI